MPYTIIKSGSGYKVMNKQTKKYYSNNPIPKANAEAQMRLLELIYKRNK
jgi:hypothetical protein